MSFIRRVSSRSFALWWCAVCRQRERTLFIFVTDCVTLVMDFIAFRERYKTRLLITKGYLALLIAFDDDDDNFFFFIKYKMESANVADAIQCTFTLMIFP